MSKQVVDKRWSVLTSGNFYGPNIETFYDGKEGVS